jgi:hypothetical protein
MVPIPSPKATDEAASVAESAKPLLSAAEDGSRILACAACREGVTTAAARITVGGSHEHRVTSPDGAEFHIGCFARASGCKGSGDPSSSLSWFPGYLWQIAECARCGVFLGWRFRSAEHRFHGLILDRLAEPVPTT